MSSHCSRYPGCGCSAEIGTKCHMPSEKEAVDVTSSEWKRQYPEQREGESVEDMKCRVRNECDRRERGTSGKAHRKHATKYTPPKKRKRK